MSPSSKSPEMPQPHSQGEHWLELLGYGHLKDMPTGHVIDGEPVLAKDFDKLCAEHARPTFTALEALNSNNPDHQKYFDAARKTFHAHFMPSQETN